MTRSAIALSLVLVIPALGARAEDPPQGGCSVGSTNILMPDSGKATGDEKGEVTINCSGLTEAFGNQFAELLTRILHDRLDPQMVIAKLDEVDRVPQAGVARSVDESQRQLIIKNLNGKPPGQVAITAHPAVEDSAEFARAIATSLLTVGWQIEGQQIRRAAPKALEAVPGLAVVVRDKGAAPQPALQLQAALNAAHLAAALVADPSLAADTTLLWIGRRPAFAATEPGK